MHTTNDGSRGNAPPLAAATATHTGWGTTVLEGPNLAKAARELRDVMKENEEALTQKTKTIRQEVIDLVKRAQPFPLYW